MKNPPANARDTELICELERSPREGNGNPLPYSCQEIPWTEEPGVLQFMGSQKTQHDLVTKKTNKQTKKKKTKKNSAQKLNKQGDNMHPVYSFPNFE